MEIDNTKFEQLKKEIDNVKNVNKNIHNFMSECTYFNQDLASMINNRLADSDYALRQINIIIEDTEFNNDEEGRNSND
jgi:formyltetrahydrofolate synthetase